MRECETGVRELKKNGKFKLGGILNMKLKKKPARRGQQPIHQGAMCLQGEVRQQDGESLEKLKEAINRAFLQVRTHLQRSHCWTRWVVSPAQVKTPYTLEVVVSKTQSWHQRH